MQEDNLGRKNIKGDNSREIRMYVGGKVKIVIRLTVLFYLVYRAKQRTSQSTHTISVSSVRTSPPGKDHCTVVTNVRQNTPSLTYL